MAGHAGGGFHVDDNTRLIDVFGPPRDYNNFQEPKPWTNEPSVLIGFVTAFLVSANTTNIRTETEQGPIS